MIVKTLLDTDLYKFTTSYAYIKLFPYAMGTFSFNDRNETQYTKAFFIPNIFYLIHNYGKINDNIR